MCLSVLSPLAAAEQSAEKQAYKVVAIGDSTSNGFGHNDYGLYAKHDYMLTKDGLADSYLSMWGYGFGFLDTGSKDAYPYRLSQYIQEQHPEYDVQFTNLGISGIRNTEIRAIIDSDYDGDSYTETYLNNTIYYLETAFDIESLHDLFVEEIKSADLITIDAVMNSFTDYLQSRLSEIDFSMAENGDNAESEVVNEKVYRYNDSLADVIGQISPEMDALIKPVVAAFSNAFGDVLTKNQLTVATDAIVYACASCFVNFTELVKLVRELNPDARILVSGGYNAVPGKSFVYGDMKINVNELLNVLNGALDAYITGIDPNRFYYSFIDVPEGIETFSEYIASADTMWDFDPDFLRELIDDIFGTSHIVATPLCVEARAEGTARGLDISAYYPLYSDSLYAILENVREKGDEAPEMDRILADKFEKYISYIIPGANATELDVDTAIEAASNARYMDILDMMDTPVEELSTEQLTRLYFLQLLVIKGGIGAHFSFKGCDQKYAAALKAYNSKLPAAFDLGNVNSDIARNAATGIFGAIKIPLLQKLHSILDSIMEFFRNLFIPIAN